MQSQLHNPKLFQIQQYQCLTSNLEIIGDCLSFVYNLVGGKCDGQNKQLK